VLSSVVNTCLVCNKSAGLNQTIVDSQLDLLLITETWHENIEFVSFKQVAPAGFECMVVARPLSSRDIHSPELHNHGGIALIYHWELDGRKLPPTQRPSWCGLVPRTVYSRFLAVVFLWCSEPTSSYLTSFLCWECCSLQTCQHWTSMSPQSLPSVFSSCDNYAVFNAR